MFSQAFVCSQGGGMIMCPGGMENALSGHTPLDTPPRHPPPPPPPEIRSTGGRFWNAFLFFQIDKLQQDPFDTDTNDGY